MFQILNMLPVNLVDIDLSDLVTGQIKINHLESVYQE